MSAVPPMANAPQSSPAEAHSTDLGISADTRTGDPPHCHIQHNPSETPAAASSPCLTNAWETAALSAKPEAGEVGSASGCGSNGTGNGKDRV